MINSLEDLPPALAATVSTAEKKHIAAIKSRGLLPFAVTRHFASLALPHANDPIRRQFFPDPREAESDPFALDDPLGQCLHLAAPRLVHQYKNRALLLATNTCAGYCRHCFRRVWISQSAGFSESQTQYCPNENYQSQDWKAAFEYLATHKEIKEALISGGDPLTLDNDKLVELFCALRKARPGINLRICTRVPITEPIRLDSETIALFASFRPLWLSVHINHPRELCPLSRAALASCLSAGISVKTQTVLMRGINDDPSLLAALFSDFSEMGLSPYYLFQLDLAPGTAHFRVPLRRGLAIFKELGALIPASILPRYVVDLPGGGGKIALHENVITEERVCTEGNVYVLKDSLDGQWCYPAE